jgi:transcriptional regulator with XRE-family HTH domain
LFGQRVRNHRQRRGWTQQELAGRAGLTHETISNYETGKRRNPSLAIAEAIAGALEVPVAELVAEPEPEVAATP